MKVLGVSITLCTILSLGRSINVTGLCDVERHNCSNLTGSFCPQCDTNGNFLPQQCWGSTGSCWCVDIISGNKIPNTTTPPGDQLRCGLCKIQQSTCRPIPGRYCPQCDNNGNFLPQQCWGSTGSCWCVDIISGNKIPCNQGNETLSNGTAADGGEGGNQPNKPGAAEDGGKEGNWPNEPGAPADGGEEGNWPNEPGAATDSGEEGNQPNEPGAPADSGEEGNQSNEPGTDIHDCPKGWSRFNELCFIFINSPKSWVEAEVYCQFERANLASVHSDNGNHFIMSLTRGNSHSFPQTWLGGFDAIHPGYWMWSDGSEFDYNNWAENDDDDGQDKPKRNKNCLKINYEYDLKWFYASCSDSHPFVCAKALTPPVHHI